MRAWPIVLALAQLSILSAAPAGATRPAVQQAAPPVVIAHRGDSAHLPEHTLAAYARAIAHGADWVEPDLVSTRDGVLVARHENEIGDTTDVAAHPEYAARRRRQQVDGLPLEGWFVEDFTLAELKRLRARERLPQLRGSAHDGTFDVPTLAEIIAVVAEESRRHGRLVGLAPELKHPGHFRAQGLGMEETLLATLDAHAHTRVAPVAIQSFEVGNLRALRRSLGARTNLRLVQLLGDPRDQPADQAAVDGGLRYGDMMHADGLRAVAAYADAIGPPLRAVVPLDAAGAPGAATPLVTEAHAAGLRVYPYTFRPENHFLPPALRAGDDPRARNEAGAIADIRHLLDAGIDGFFSDDVAVGRAAVDGWRSPAAATPAPR